MKQQRYEYGPQGSIGLIVPQANPTVEAELRLLVPDDIMICTVRSVSTAADPCQRLQDYLMHLPAYLEGYDTFRPDIFAFGCTGSSYMIGADAEASLVSDVANTYGRPVLTATEAIYQALSKLNAKRVRLLAPYPQALLDKAQHYWAARGVEITEAVSILPEIEDTRNIYTLTSDRLLPQLSVWEDVEEPVLISGTGLPSLSVLARVDNNSRLSSNLCLAWSVLNIMGQLPPAAKPMDCIHKIKPRLSKIYM